MAGGSAVPGPGARPRRFAARAGLALQRAPALVLFHALLWLALAFGGRPAVGQEAEQAHCAECARVNELATASIEEAAAMVDLCTLLAEYDEQRERGRFLHDELVFSLHGAALTVPLSSVPAAQRAIPDAEAWALADRLAEIARSRERPWALDLFASTAAYRVQANQLALRLDEARAELEHFLTRDEPFANRAKLEILRADLHRYEREWESARARLEDAAHHLEQADEADRPDLRIQLALVAARLEHNLGRIDRQARHLRAARKVEGAHPGWERLIALEEVLFFLAVGNSDAALKELERHEDSNEVRLRRGMARLLLPTSQAADERLGRLDIATLLERNPLPTERAAGLIALADSLEACGDVEGAGQRLGELDETPLRAALAPGDVARKAEIESRLLRRTGAERDRLQAARATLAAAQNALLELWRAVPLEDDDVGYLHRPADRGPLGELMELALALDGEAGSAHALELLLESQCLGTLARREGLQPSRAADLQAALQPGEVLLAYYFAPHRGYLFRVEPRSIELHRLDGERDVAPRVREFARRFSEVPAETGLRADVARQARELGDTFLPPAWAPLLQRASRVFVVGAESLGDFPFEALRDADGRWFGARFALEHALSLPLLIERRRVPRPVAKGAGLAWLAPTNTRFGAAIGASKGELEAFSKAWKPLTIRSGSEATRASTLAAAQALGSARAALFLAHGVLDWSRVVPNGIALATSDASGDVLWFEDILALSGPELVVLGVCNAAEGPERRGQDGGNDLVGAWLRAGTREVVASPFYLEAESTLRQLIALGRELERAPSVAAALRTVRAAEVERDPRSDPFFHQLLAVRGWGR